jgi:gluconolactonase
VERIQEFPNGGTHESPIWLPDSNEFLYSTVSEVGKMYAIEIDSHDVRTINLNPSLSNVDGGTSHRGVVYVATQGGPVRGIHRVNPTSGATEVVVNNYYGRHFNSPNDIVFDAADNMWFTDPTYGQDSRWPGVQASELPQSIYRLDARSKALQAVSTAIISKPNGIALSPDERTLYVCDSLASNNDLSAQRAVWAFDVRPNGAGLDAPRLVHQLEGGWPDGIKVSESGLLMVAAAGGVDVVDPATGVRVGKINVAGDEIINLAAATGKGAWLLTGQSGIYKVTMKEGGKEL